MAGLFEDVSLYFDFQELVQKYLPDKATEIYLKPYSQRPSAFVDAFSVRYFPIYDPGWGDENEVYKWLCLSIPIETYGYNSDNDDAPDDMPLELCLAHSLIEDSVNPTNEHLDWLKTQEWGPDGPNPADIARVHPRRGVELHKRLDGTMYSFLAEFADWLWWDTGNGLLDYDEEQGGGGMPEWSDEEVKGGTEVFAECKKFWEREATFFAWLKSDLRRHYHLLVVAIEGVTEPVNKDHQLALWEGQC